MARRAFYSFHYQDDHWRAGQVRNMGVIDGNRPVSDNDWESIKKGGDSEIEKWINDQLFGTSCTIILIGENTASRHWVNYEIRQSWNKGKGILGIHINNLLDQNSAQSKKGKNPFDNFKINDERASSIVKAYDSIYASSKYTYDYIKDNLGNWIEDAIKIREQYR